MMLAGFCLVLYEPRPGVAGERRVLLLNSYHHGYRWTDELTAAFEGALSDEPGVRLFVEFMDAKRYDPPALKEAVLLMLERKYGPEPLRPDVVLCNDDPALDLVLAERDRLFPGVPLVFTGINDFQPERIEGHAKVTGVVEAYDFAGTMETIRRLHPKTRRFLVVADSTRSTRAAADRVRRALSESGEGIDVTWLDDASSRELSAALEALRPGAVVLYLSWLRPAEGDFLTLEESRGFTASHSPVPVYCFWDFVPGTGLVGGRGMSAENQGRTAARLVRRILGGEDPDQRGLEVTPPNRYVFDWEQLRRFDVDTSALPEDSLVINRQLTFYERNWAWLWGIAVFLALESVLVGAWVVGRRKQRGLQEQLRQAQKMEAVGRLAGGIAHDFRNQLSVVEGYARLLLHGCSDEEEGGLRLRRIIDAARRAEDLTDQLLAFSRTQVLRSVPQNLNLVVEELAEPLARLIGEDVTLDVQPEHGAERVLVDRNQLEQAVFNLATNARDAMPEGGRLTLRVVSEPEESMVRLDVEDDGEGIPPEVTERVFEPFYTTKEVGRGTGLGLAMVYGFAQQSGGRAGIHSTLGQGTRVSIWLPATAAAGADAGSPPTKAQQVQMIGDETILVVEDDPAVLEMVTDSLKQYGYQVLSTTIPEEAVSLIGDQGNEFVDLLLTDVVMPGMYGPEVASLLEARVPELPVLYMSGYTAFGAGRPDVLPPGADMLSKPFSPAELALSVRRILDRRP